MKFTRLVDRRCDDIAQYQECNSGRNYEEAIRRKPAESVLRKYSAISSRSPVARESAGNSAAETDILNKLTGRIERNCPNPETDTDAQRQKAGDHLVDVSADLHHATAHKNRPEVTNHCLNVRRFNVENRTEAGQELEHFFGTAPGIARDCLIPSPRQHQ